MPRAKVEREYAVCVCVCAPSVLFGLPGQF